MQLGAIQAMKEAGLKPGKDFLMVSVDGVPDMFRSLVAGEANASVELKSDIGAPIYDVVEAYLKGKTDWPKWVLIDSDLHTQADARRRDGEARPEVTPSAKLPGRNRPGLAFSPVRPVRRLARRREGHTR